MKNAVIYTRISTKNNILNIVDEQMLKCLKFALSNDYSILTIFHDVGKTGTDLRREGLQELLKFCADMKNGINVVIVYSLDRLSTSEDDYRYILEPYFKEHNIKLISIKDQLV